MAKRKRGFRRAKDGVKLGAVLIGAGAYGAVREKISNALMPITSKIPLGNIADEIALLTAGYFMAKKTSGVLKDVGKAAMYVEAARIGEAAINGQIGIGASSSTPSLWA